MRAGLVIHVRHPGATTRKIRPDERGDLFRSQHFSGRHPGQTFPWGRNGSHRREILSREGAFRAFRHDGRNALSWTLRMGRHSFKYLVSWNHCCEKVTRKKKVIKIQSKQTNKWQIFKGFSYVVDTHTHTHTLVLEQTSSIWIKMIYRFEIGEGDMRKKTKCFIFVAILPFESSG